MIPMRPPYFIAALLSVLAACDQSSPNAQAHRCVARTQRAPEQIVVITDMEPDDRRALRVLAKSPLRSKVKLIGTTALGTPVKTALARRLLQQLGMGDVPVVQGWGGAPGDYPPTLSSLAARTFRHEGVGVFSAVRLAELADKPRQSHALALALIDTIRRHHQTDVLVLGPATDLAEALRRDPELVSGIRCVHMVGGWVDRKSRGQRSTYNWNMQPHAANAILANKRVPVVLHSSHVFQSGPLGVSVNRSTHPLVWRTIVDRSLSDESVFEDGVASATWDRHIISTYPPLRNVVGPHVGRNFSPTDPAAAIALAYPKLIEDFQVMKVRVDTKNFDPKLGFRVIAEPERSGHVALVRRYAPEVFRAKLRRTVAK